MQRTITTPILKYEQADLINTYHAMSKFSRRKNDDVFFSRK